VCISIQRLGILNEVFHGLLKSHQSNFSIVPLYGKQVFHIDPNSPFIMLSVEDIVEKCQ
jgi:hypothetical protein